MNETTAIISTKVDPTDNAFVTAATASAQLYEIIAIAKEMNLSALNAKVITARAGDIGRGFKPLTEFVSELAQQTAEAITKINSSALAVSRASVEQIRAQTARNYFEISLKRNGENNKELQKLLKEAEDTLNYHNKNLEKNFRQLFRYVSDIEYQMKSASYIGSNCRIEAGHVQEFRGDFETVAENIEHSTSQIKDLIDDCRSNLHKYR